jgi:hypothetical protein
VLSQLRTRGSRPMTAVTWLQLLARASTIDEVITTSREYTASLDHVVLARLPMELQPGKLFDTHDIASYAYDLARHHDAAEDREVAATINALGSFFSAAVQRLAQLAAPHPAGRELVKLFSN